MTKRMQVLFEDIELTEIRRVARRHKMTVAEWVRQALRRARRAESGGDPRQKVAAVREAAGLAYPTATIDDMRDEIGVGYLDTRTVRAGDVAKAWGAMPRLTASEASAFSGEVSRARKAIVAPKATWE
jgi:hypothetical protein